MVTRLLDSESAAAIAGAVLTVLLAMLGLDVPRWDARTRARQGEYDTIKRNIQRNYSRRPRGQEYYKFAPLLSIGRTISSRNKRLSERASIAARLADESRQEGIECAIVWANAVGAFANEASRWSRIPLRRFLQTNHNSIIREACIALPFIVVARARKEIDEDAFDLACCGIALMELAAFYNSLAPQQREPVYFLAEGHDAPLGPIVRAPRTVAHLWLTPANVLLRSLRLRGWRIACARRRLTRLAAGL